MVKYGRCMAACPDLSPRARRTRDALIAAGLELLVDRPIEAVAIDEIVARAGVAKGSFFNHFADKPEFAAAVAAGVRLAVEGEVGRFNAAARDPVERIAGGMAVAARLAVEAPRRMMVLLRAQGAVTGPSHPLNRGLREDLEAARAAGLLRPEAGAVGVTYWLGLCQVLMQDLIGERADRALAARRLAEMVVLGLAGLGVPDERARAAAATIAARAFA